MAVLTLTLNNVSCYEQETSDSSVTYSGTTESVSISSEKKGDTLYLNCKDDDINRDIHGYTFDMVEYKFQKKMYQPTEILAHIQINMASEKTWTLIGRKRIESTFKHKQVKLEVDGDSIGWDFYVHAVLPSYKSDSMIVDLKIYSIDKVMTLDKTCHSYVGKKLGPDILQRKLLELRKPYSQNECFPTYNDRMQVLKYDRDSKKAIEHIFPYLVQYNESFYDMLIRTCNRWGEFVYWEMGQLYIGYDNSSSNTKSIPSGYKTITYPNIDKTSNLISDKNRYNNYFPVGADDSTIRDTNAKESKWEAKAKIGTPKKMYDVYWLQWLSQLFATNKDMASFAASKLFNDVVDWGLEELAIKLRNIDYNNDYFPDSRKKGTTPEQYNQDMTALNEFTEIDTEYNDAKYKDILKYELKAMENIVEIDYGNTWPGLKLGEIIKKDNETFIVVEVDCEKNSDDSPVFRILAIGSFKFTDENNNTTYKFYPPMLPTGHVRYSGPQKATVQEASSDDPCDQNRVRVAFPWQMQDQTTWVGDLSPRIRIASADGGANMASRFYKGDSVMIGFIDGNIERPYILGSIPKIGTVMNNVHTMTTPGGHAFNLTDGTGQGFAKFMSSAFTPVVNTFSGIFPTVDMDIFGGDMDNYFEGGFSLTDRYGIYSISGSTDRRIVEIKSPWGNVEINAFTGIKIMAPNGDISIVGKNVNIAAGNNLTLTSGTNIKERVSKNKHGNNFFYWKKENVALAVAERFAQRLVKLIDLTVVRSAVEIVMRPVEGTLTLKSMRYMKLEGGMTTKCDFPASAYSTDDDTKEKLSEKANLSSLRNVVSQDASSLGNCIINIFKKIPTFANKLLNDWLYRNQAMENNKGSFDEVITQLKEFANDDNDVCKSYTDLKTDFWENSNYVEWDETKLDFKENVAKDKDENTDDYISKVAERFYTGLTLTEDKKEMAKAICDQRKSLREEVLKKANNLRKSICDALNYKITKELIKGSFKDTKDPDEQFISKISEAISKDKCPNSILYKAYDEDYKNFGSRSELKEDDKKYLKRLIIYNLLIALGFNESSRREIKINQNDKETTAIAEPNTNDTSSDGKRSIMNDEYWNNYIKSLSGVPTIKKQQAEAPALDNEPNLTQQLKDTFKKSSGISDAYALGYAIRERNIWSNGKQGGVLIGANRKTYQLDEHAQFKEITTFEPDPVTYTEDTRYVRHYDKNNMIAYMNKLRDELIKL